MATVVLRGQWLPVVLGSNAEGMIDIKLVSRVTARVGEGIGQDTLGREVTRGHYVIPINKLSSNPTRIAVTSLDGNPFPTGTTVNLNLRVTTTADDYSIEELTVAGRHETSVLELLLSPEGNICMSAVESGLTSATSQTSGLGQWVVNRRSETGSTVKPNVDLFVVDTSISMNSKQDDLTVLQDFINQVYGSAGLPNPRWQQTEVGGRGTPGIGAANVGAVPGERVVVITDIPPRASSGFEAIVLQEADISGYFARSSVSHVGLDEDDIQFLRQDNNSEQTRKSIEELVTWLSRSELVEPDFGNRK